MTIKKKILVTTLGLTAFTFAYATRAQIAKADDSTTYPPFVQKLAERFGLNTDEVNTFFQEQHQERVNEMNENREERLSQAVTDGVITEEQKQAILDHQDEMMQEREQNREEHRDEMDTWFEENEIDHEALMQYMGPGPEGHGGPGGPRGMGPGFGQTETEE